MSQPSAREIIAEAIHHQIDTTESFEEIADTAIGDLRTAGYAIVRVPDIACRGPHDTNGTMLLTAAEKAESARYPVGGSNVGRAVAQVLREVAAASDQQTYLPEGVDG
ncbi:hypothetical protein [Mycobacterium sp. TY815]|uniref:hypothetical protein n=1 Tax=Mycobacterium sp. TY815 TaxID=3050581 RepID=UPI0027417439|nr:hypothetical protein [Mycobacterium sp. TY815]MDP7706819.1 hypothetical protein [Mycobacterium sp. TY815]